MERPALIEKKAHKWTEKVLAQQILTYKCLSYSKKEI